MTTNEKTTAIYVRTAVHNRSGEQSVAMQEQVCRSYAAALGWRVGEVFADEGSAGTSADRSGLRRLLSAVRDRMVERVLIASPDRLSRNHADRGAILQEMEARGVEYVCVEQPTYLPKPDLASDSTTDQQPH